jgi:hypothetical protein
VEYKPLQSYVPYISNGMENASPRFIRSSLYRLHNERKIVQEMKIPFGVII